MTYDEDFDRYLDEVFDNITFDEWLDYQDGYEEDGFIMILG